MADPNWTLELLKIGQGLLGTLVGGGLVLLGSLLTDRRRNRSEEELRHRREQALLTGMFAVRNFIVLRLNEWVEKGNLSDLNPLRTAQAYVHRLIEKAPSESETLMIAVMDVGLRLDALIAATEEYGEGGRFGLPNQAQFASYLESRAAELEQSLEQFDLISGRALPMLSDADLAEFAQFDPASKEVVRETEKQ